MTADHIDGDEDTSWLHLGGRWPAETEDRRQTMTIRGEQWSALCERNLPSFVEWRIGQSSRGLTIRAIAASAQAQVASREEHKCEVGECTSCGSGRRSRVQEKCRPHREDNGK
ncbi:uncharacterized protein SCHCODRAFT_02247626 [Schizophyllum commune H4-8]|uniref:uncharacterized protein n=1 Tax=Schizophyllum commune (strain H4-8 / FGSC 9210) TaxID=578458 RepID=UPI00215E620B|nr:uncharacterized protein SCHCODRAFT_02247626 [Schizophyllum commune H4-8]KAI5893206.1 hypothetical protein SCHCODRAFT_02247626 [Schizophyllum commune H4-8]